MEHIQHMHESPKWGQLFSVTVWQLREQIARHLSHKGVGRKCHVVVNRDGQVLELSGNVESQSTLFEILSMIPDEERCVRNNIQVVPCSV